ncbi:MAG TPA: TraX family protein [Candidatus Atribacteria bacterium]|nr:TraX family protein [Candidatus Atribacteria bacterium]
MLRLIALVTMLIDHIGAVFFPQYIFFRIIGRIAFPLFAWGVARGYRHTRNIWLYAARLLVLGLIAQYPYMQLFDTKVLNICFTLFVSLIVLKLYDSKNKIIAYTGVIGVLALTVLLELKLGLVLEYQLYGILTVLFFHIFWGRYELVLYQGILTLAGTFIYNFHIIQCYSVISSLLVLTLEKYDFRLNKVLTYGFYPLHIIILWLLKMQA